MTVAARSIPPSTRIPLWLRFAASSVVTSLAEYAAFLALAGLVGVHYVAASVFAGAGGILVNFALNRRIGGGADMGPAREQFARHLFTTALGIVLGAAVLYLLVEAIGLPYWLGWLVQNVGVFFAFTYPMNRRYVFAAKAPSTAAAEKSAIVAYYDSVAEGYGHPDQEGFFSLIRQREQRALLEALDPRPGDVVLDAGCGAGGIARLMRARGARVWGVDLSPKMLAEAEPHLDVSIHADLDTLDLGRAFDAVMCSGALEFSADPRAALARLARHLRPGGRLVLLVPLANLGGWLYGRVQARRGMRPSLLSSRGLLRWARELDLVPIARMRPCLHCAVVGLVRTR